MSERDRRIGSNEALFRDVNERISRIQENFGHAQSFEIVCECGRPDCEDRVQITHQAYREVRSNPLHFVVVPGHEKPDIERIVERGETYVVIEKTDEEAAEIAEETA